MKKTIFVMAVLCIGMVGLAQADTVDLVAGQDMVVGTVEVTKILVGPDAGDLLVKYLLDADCDGVVLTETHLHIGKTLADFPLTGGKHANPKIGKFDYSEDHDPGVTEVVYQIPAGNLPTEPYLIGAHAVTGTEYCSVDDLPETVTAVLTFDQSLDTYFKLAISGGILDGDHGAWCADIDLDALGGSLLWTVVPSVPDEINCLLNNDYVGETAADGNDFTIGDVQLAIWIIFDPALEDLDDLKADTEYAGKAEDLNNWFGPYKYLGGPPSASSQAAHVAQILEEVADCELDPGCCDVMGILLYPPLAEPLNQPILIQIPAPCCETAWGDGEFGSRFSTSSWATYFSFPD